MTQPAPSRSCPPGQSILPEVLAPEPEKAPRSSLGQHHIHQVRTALSWQALTPTQSLPLRGRDLQALKDLFNRSEIEAIESDILRNLDWRCPEPCWEDDPFEFLREYL